MQQSSDIKSYILYFIMLIVISFIVFSGIILIIYGNKIIKNEISSDDKKAGEFIVVFGYFETIFGIIIFLLMLLLSFLIPIFKNLLKKKLETYNNIKNFIPFLDFKLVNIDNFFE
jgi:hypothetical protein